jgi:prephenate dehydratase
MTNTTEKNVSPALAIIKKLTPIQFVGLALGSLILLVAIFALIGKAISPPQIAQRNSRTTQEQQWQQSSSMADRMRADAERAYMESSNRQAALVEKQILENNKVINETIQGLQQQVAQLATRVQNLEASRARYIDVIRPDRYQRPQSYYAPPVQPQPRALAPALGNVLATVNGRVWVEDGRGNYQTMAPGERASAAKRPPAVVIPQDGPVINSTDPVALR